LANVPIFDLTMSFSFSNNLRLTTLSSLQIFQLMRYGTLFLNSVLMGNFLRSVDDVSAYETLFLYGSTFYNFWLTGINNTMFPEKAIHGRKIYFNSFIILLVFAVVAGFAMMGYAVQDPTLHNKALMEEYSVYTMINAPTYLTEFLLILEMQYIHVLIYAGIIFLLQIASNIVPVFLGYDLFTVVHCLMVLSIIKFIYLMFLLRRYAIRKFEWAISRQLFSKSVPMMLSLLLSGSIDFINGYLARHFLGALEFAKYRLGAREFPIFLIMTNTLSNVMSGHIAGRYNEEDKSVLDQLKEKSSTLMRYLFPSAILLMILSRPLFKILYFNKAQFVDACMIFNILLLLLVSRFIFAQTVLLGLHKNRYIAYASIVEWISIVIGANLLVHHFHIYGIVMATVIGFYIEKVVLWHFCRRQGIRLSQYLDTRKWILYSLLLWLTFGIVVFLNQ
jgi:O-antigen/teichoic acid export membrane protein